MEEDQIKLKQEEEEREFREKLLSMAVYFDGSKQEVTGVGIGM